MRSDFSNENKKDSRRKGFTRSRIVRALIFIAIGFGIGVWLNSKPKSEQPPSPGVQPQAELVPEQRVEGVELPINELS